jgi:hypothetical protein
MSHRPTRRPLDHSASYVNRMRAVRNTLVARCALNVLLLGLFAQPSAASSFGVCALGAAQARAAHVVSVDPITGPIGACSTTYVGPVAVSAGTSTGDVTQAYRNSVSGQMDVAHSSGASSLSGLLGLGELHGVVSASGGSSVGLNGPRNGVPVNTAGGGVANLHEFWLDRITVSSNTLVLGAPVDLMFSMALDGSTFALAPDRPGLQNSALATAYFQAGVSQVRLQSEPATSAGLMTSFILRSSVGAVVPLEAQLILSATANANARLGVDEALSTASFSNTAAYYVDVLTHGASYVADSGFVYRTLPIDEPAPVPEPGTVIYLGSGILAIVRARTRR